MKSLDPQVLFDPFEKQFHLLAVAVDIGDRRGGDGEMVGQKDEPLALLPVEVGHPPQGLVVDPGA